VGWKVKFSMADQLGRKFDAGKPEYGLIPPNALNELAVVLTGERRYFDAMQRHLWAFKRGERLDPETGRHHLGHAMACLFFLYELETKAYDASEQITK